MLFDNPTFSTPIHTVYDRAVAANDSAILTELSMEHVRSVFQDHLTQHADYEFLPNSKFGPLMLQRITDSDSVLDLYFFRPENGLELCYFILDDMIMDVFFKIMEPLVPFLQDTPKSLEFGHPCTAEHEQIIRKKVAPFLDQFPLTKNVLFDRIINYPCRLYF